MAAGLPAGIGPAEPGALKGHRGRASLRRREDAVSLPELDERARKALAAVRAQASALRFAVERPCGAERARLSVYYRGAGYRGAPGSDEFRLGLAYAEDERELEVLREALEAEERGR